MIQEIAPQVYHLEYQVKEPAAAGKVFCFREGCVLLTRERRVPLRAQLGDCPIRYRYLFAIDREEYYLGEPLALSRYPVWSGCPAGCCGDWSPSPRPLRATRPGIWSTGTGTTGSAAAAADNGAGDGGAQAGLCSLRLPGVSPDQPGGNCGGSRRGPAADDPVRPGGPSRGLCCWRDLLR